MTTNAAVPSIHISIGIMAYNEERSILTTLESLFRQSLFERLRASNRRCEIICLANGCTDRTVEVAGEYFHRMEREHPHAAGFAARVVDIREPGRNNAWNRFVHEYSAPSAAFLCLMDADIIFLNPDTLHRLASALERDTYARVASGRARKDLEFKERRSLLERLSLATSAMTGTIEGGFTGQLHCLRSEVVRNLRLPRDLGATEDGFLKAAVCTDCFTATSDPRRVAAVPGAEHLYEAYVLPSEILNNQKRQMIGQAIVYVLEQYIRGLPVGDRRALGETIRRLELRDPEWLQRLVERRLRRVRVFWRLFPGLLGFRFQRLAKLRGTARLTHLPAACLGFGVTLVASWRAFRHLRRGSTQFWPKATRGALLSAGR